MYVAQVCKFTFCADAKPSITQVNLKEERRGGIVSLGRQDMQWITEDPKKLSLVGQMK